MADSDRSVRPAACGSAHNQGRVQLDRCMPVLSREPRQKRRSLLKGWRPLLFLLAVLVAIGAGLHFKTLAEPGRESVQFADEALPSFNIFVSDPRISVSLSADVYCNLPTSTDIVACTTASSMAHVIFYLTADAPPSLRSSGIVLMTSSIGAAGPRSDALPFSSYSVPPGNARIYEQEFNVADLQSGGSSSADFYLPNVLEKMRGSVFGKLPAIGNLDQFEGSYPSMLTEFRPGTTSIEDLIYLPSLKPGQPQTDDSSAYQTINGDPAKLFWRPNVLSITDTLENFTGVIGTQQIDYMTPAGTVSGENYVWNSSSELQPNFKSTDPEATDSQSNNAFISGIFLGIAGAAAIALIQELPERVTLGRRGRNSPARARQFRTP